MLNEFQKKYAKINSGKQFNETYDEPKAWRAYNRTVTHCSKNFLKILNFSVNEMANGNNTAPVGKDTERAFVEYLIETQKLNEIYELFVEKFYSQIQIQLETHGHSVFRKLQRKLYNNLSRFKQR